MIIIQKAGYPSVKPLTPRRIASLKRRFATLKGWIKRKEIKILDCPEPGALFVEYMGQYMRTIGRYKSPNGEEDADTVQEYLEIKAILTNLDES